ncbi:MAG: GMC family oxidoreductase [Candidatus Binatia bacterium]
MTERRIHVGSTLEHDLALEADVIVVGTGAGGAISAEVLAGAGLRVVMVEEGAYRRPEEVPLREPWSLSRLYREGGAIPTRDGALTVVQGRTVGGSTVVNWTSSFRTPEPTLRHWREHHGIEGLGADDLAPWFDAIEARLNIGPWQDHNRNNQLLAVGAERLGWSHAAINRNVRECAGHGTCGLGCPVGAKQSMDVTTIPAALDHGAELVTRVRAERLVLRDGRVVGVEAVALDERGLRPTGRRVHLRAPWVVVSAGAINSPALLLRSRVPDPSGRIGRRTFLQLHNYSLSFMPGAIAPFHGAPQSIYTNQFTWRDGVTGRAGFNMEVVGAQPVVSMSFWKGLGTEMADYARRLPRLHILVSQIRDGFHDDSQGGIVRLRRDGAGVLDYPITDYVWDGVRSSYLAMAECQFAAGAESVHPACSDARPYRSWGAARAGIGALTLRSPNVYVNSTHPLGGCAMGSDPRTSVVGADGRHHHVGNLYVIDGSVFPTSLGVNPCESIYALAARNATLLADRATSREHPA